MERVYELYRHRFVVPVAFRWPYSLFAGLVDVCWPHSAGKREQAQQTGG